MILVWNPSLTTAVCGFLYPRTKLQFSQSKAERHVQTCHSLSASPKVSCVGVLREDPWGRRLRLPPLPHTGGSRAVSILPASLGLFLSESRPPSLSQLPAIAPPFSPPNTFLHPPLFSPDDLFQKDPSPSPQAPHCLLFICVHSPLLLPQLTKK